MSAISVYDLAKQAASRCWTGYEPVPGKTPYSEDSCRPVGSKPKKKEKKAANCGCGSDEKCDSCGNAPCECNSDSDPSLLAKVAAVKLIIKAAGKRGLWDNIHAKRKRGESPAKPGEKDYPDSKSWNATVKAGAVDKLISLLATGRLKKAALKKAWEVGDDTGWYKAAVTDIDPKLLKILRSQLGKGSFTPDTLWSNHGDDLDLVETIMEYEAQNAGDINDADLGFYADKPDRYGFRTVRPDLTFGQIQEGLHRSFKPSVAAILGKKAATAAWTRAEGKSESGGLNAKGRASLKAQGHDIKPPVTEDNPTGERAGRKASFCARMSGMKNKLTSKETARDPDSRINKSLRKWKC